MASYVSHLADVHRQAQIGNDVSIGPFCVVGPDVTIGDGCVLDSHVALVGQTTIGRDNRFWPQSAIGGEPQDRSWKPADTGVEIGDDNQFREGVTVHRGAEKEDGMTRIGHRNLFMANSHVAHNCWVFNETILVNGVLLGGHVHVHDGAIMSGNSAIHHFSTIGTLAFIGGVSRASVDVPPYMLHSGNDHPKVATINVVGMRRRGISEEVIGTVRHVFKRVFREHGKISAVRRELERDGAELAEEVETLISFIEHHSGGRSGRGRETRNVTSLIGPPERPLGLGIRKAA